MARLSSTDTREKALLANRPEILEDLICGFRDLSKLVIKLTGYFEVYSNNAMQKHAE